MGTLHRVRVQWKTFVSGPAVSTLFFNAPTPTDTTAQAVIDRTRDFLASFKSGIYSAVTWDVLGAVDDIDSGTGDLVGQHSVLTRSDGGSGTNNPVPQANQVNIRFETGVIIAGKRLRGHLYVPGYSSFTSAGAVSGVVLTAVPTAAAAFIGSSNVLDVWHRPLGPHGTVSPGSAWGVTSLAVQTKFAVLRSRRD